MEDSRLQSHRENHQEEDLLIEGVGVEEAIPKETHLDDPETRIGETKGGTITQEEAHPEEGHQVEAHPVEVHQVEVHQVEVHRKMIQTGIHLPTGGITTVGEVRQDMIRHLIVMIRDPQRVQ